MPSYAKFYKPLMTARISDGAKIVFCALLDFQELKLPNPKIETLAEATGKAPRTVRRDLLRLRDLGLIQIRWGQRQSSYEIAKNWQILLGQSGRTEKPKWPHRNDQSGRTEPAPPYYFQDFSNRLPTPPTYEQTNGGGGGRGEFPQTLQTLREFYPSVDEAFVLRLAQAAVQAAISVEGRRRAEFSDQLLADAVRQCREDCGYQRSAGLFLKTVPRLIATWIGEGRTASEKIRPRTAVSEIDKAMERLRAKQTTA